jgi:HK97 family phage portal protein
MSLLSRIGRAFGALVTKESDDEEWAFLPQLGAVPSATGLSISQYSAITVSTVWACGNIRSKDVARCAPRLLSFDASRNDTPITNHPVAKLLRRPNRLQTWFEFAFQMHVAFMLKQNAYAAIIRDGRGNPIALIPLNPDAVSLREAPDGSLWYFVSRLGFYQTAALSSFPTAIPEEDIFHLRGLTFNSIIGAAVTDVARDSIGVAMGLEQQAARFMKNGARPSGVLETAKQVSKEAAARLREQWESVRAGIHNAGKTAILEEGLTFKAMQLTSVDLEFIAQRRFTIEDIARWFGVPLHKLGVAGEVGKLRLDQADQSYVNTTIMPDLDMWEQKFDQVFGLSEAGLQCDFDERRLLRAEEATRINNQRLKVMSGLATQNECRAEEGLPPVEGADVLLTPVNLAAVGSDLSGTAADGAGRPNEGDLPDPGAANENKPTDKPADKTEAKALPIGVPRVAHFVIDRQSGIVRDALAGKREGEAPDPVATQEEDPK